jgi:site-specific DNA recombinase
MKKVAIYARRSQEHQEESVERQVTLATAFCEKKGWRIVTIYRDDQQNTGRREFVKRTQFLRMMADAEEGSFDTVVCRDLTRLGGDMARTMLAIEELKECGVTVHYFVDDTEQKLATTDKMMLAMRTGFAEQERDGISSRVREALHLKATQAYCVGGRCYGYSLVPIMNGSVKIRTEYAICPTESAIVREIFSSYANGQGLKRIASDLNSRGVPSPRGQSWSPTCIRPMLLRERYAGLIQWGKRHKTYRRGTKIRVAQAEAEWVAVDAPHLRIVDQAVWQAVAERFTRQVRLTGHRGGDRAPTKHLLSGFLKCGECGGSVSAEMKKWGAHSVDHYLCKKHRQGGVTACSNSVRRPVATVDEIVLAFMQQFSSMCLDQVMAIVKADMAKAAADAGKGTCDLEAQAKKLRTEVGKLAESLLATDTKPLIVMRMISDREQQLADLETRIAAARVKPAVRKQELARVEEAIRAKLADVSSLLGSSTDDARTALEGLLDGPLIVSREEGPDGHKLRLNGRVVLGSLVYCHERPQRDSNPPKKCTDLPIEHHALPENTSGSAAESVASPAAIVAKEEQAPPVQGDAVEAALAAAIAGATAAGQWAIVAQLAGELEARRLAKANVVSLDAARTRKGR